MVTDADSWGLGVGVGGLVAAMAVTGVAGGGCRDGGVEVGISPEATGFKPKPA